MAQFVVSRGVFRVVAIVLLALCAGFTFPENNYTIDKTFVKAPSPQTEMSSLLCDDAEDSNDYSMGVHFFQSAIVEELTRGSLYFAFTNSTLKEISLSVDNRVYLMHRQLLI